MMIRSMVDGRYRYTNTVKTNPGRGSKNEVHFVDKETGLPLRAEIFAEASGNVKGMNSAKIVAEMRNISTDAEASLFTIPEGLTRIPPEQIRAKIDAVTSTAAAVIKALLTNLNAGAPAGSTSPAATPSGSQSP